MANRFYSPNQQLCDGTGTPYAGGALSFYASGTSTPLNTYSNQALTIANTNPVVLDSAGRAGDIFLQNLAYKVVLTDVNSNVIWTKDPVFASDYSTVAQVQSGNGSPNGSVAGTAGSPTIPASVYWDATNLILYVCTQTGTASTAVWTAVNSNSSAAIITPPQGYLTTVSGTPIIASDSTGVAAVYYTPYVGNLIPIYNGTTFVPTVFTEISCALVSAHAANTIYDFFVFNNSGVLTLVTGPAWSSSTAGSCSRGTGAGTTQISRVGGIWVNTVSMTARNGSNTYTVPANQGTYVGSIYVDGTAGQVSCYRSAGQSRKWGIWNCYNRAPIVTRVVDATYNTPSGGWRAANNNSANSMTVFCGLQEEIQNVYYSIVGYVTGTASGTGQWSNSIGINTTTSPIASFGTVGTGNTATNTSTYSNLTCGIQNPPLLGISNFYAIELVNNGTGTMGTNGSTMNFYASWRG